jgi:Fe-S-cluster containining protein
MSGSFSKISKSDLMEKEASPGLPEEKPFSSPCAECGGVCCNVGLILEATRLTLDFQRWASFHDKVFLEDGYLFFLSPCKHFKDGKCAIYAERPFYCRRFNVGGTPCRLCRKLYKR